MSLVKKHLLIVAITLYGFMSFLVVHTVWSSLSELTEDLYFSFNRSGQDILRTFDLTNYYMAEIREHLDHSDTRPPAELLQKLDLLLARESIILSSTETKALDPAFQEKITQTLRLFSQSIMDLKALLHKDTFTTSDKERADTLIFEAENASSVLFTENNIFVKQKARGAYESLNEIFFIFVVFVFLLLILAGAILLIALTYFSWNRRLKVEIAQRQEAEANLAIARDEAEAANNAKSDFLARMSHDIRTPMNAVLGALQLLDSDELNGKQRKTIEIATASGANMLTLVDDVLDFAKIEAGHIELSNQPFQTASIFEALDAGFFQFAADKSLALHFDMDGRIPDTLLGDKSRLLQVLNNFVGNALKYTHQGQVTVSASLERSEEDLAWVQFAVHDTGIGITEADISQIFDPYKQGSQPSTSPAGGTGLGLAICNALVTQMKGEISVQSKLNQGSCFGFVIPLAIPSEMTAPAVSDAQSLGESRSAKILLVEDNEANQFIAQGLLEAMGHEVLIANNGQESLSLIESYCPDLVLMDIRMPVMDGLEATKKLRQDGCTIPIVALSANASTQDITATKAAGMDAYLTKPIEKAKLDQIIRDMLN